MGFVKSNTTQHCCSLCRNNYGCWCLLTSLNSGRRSIRVLDFSENQDDNVHCSPEFFTGTSESGMREYLGMAPLSGGAPNLLTFLDPPSPSSIVCCLFSVCR
eukprot:TRINITY_DN3935_c0_g1_i2.p1 TRINITY_DN3935_c0_g1~~TRINITY_DN3935_c0_g1_i2.p1  ORF type:complete len:102 (-),score=3.69 TRINITY_DN3935_c0_g1_i2:336-641(-)